MFWWPSFDTFVNIEDVSSHSLFVGKLIAALLTVVLDTLMNLPIMTQSAHITLKGEAADFTLERLFSHVLNCNNKS